MTGRNVSVVRWALASSAAVSAVIIGLIACSEGGNGTGWPTVADAEVPVRDAETVIDPDDYVDGGGGTDRRDGGGVNPNADCSTPEPRPATPSEGPYCPFAASGPITCKQNEHCCLYAQGGPKSTCNAAGNACEPQVDAGGADFECDEPGDCTGGKKCCWRAELRQDNSCPNKYFPPSATLKGTYCATACENGNVPVCRVAGDCSGSTCRIFSTKSKIMGACVQ